jgi:hypothetical protein
MIVCATVQTAAHVISATYFTIEQLYAVKALKNERSHAQLFEQRRM